MLDYQEHKDKCVLHKGFRVYRNLNKKTFSVQRYFKGMGWRVVAHQDNMILREAYFRVYNKARERVLKSKRKNVHAYIECALLIPVLDFDGYDTDLCVHEIVYNPYVANFFYIAKSGEPCLPQSLLVLRDGKAYGNNETPRLFTNDKL
jgi:hypothetical protein